MTSDDKLLDVLFSKLCKNEELRKELGIKANPTGSKEEMNKFWKKCNDKIHRQITPLDYATSDKLNFISMYYSGSTETDNDYVVRGFLQVDYYAKNRESAVKIKNLVREIFKEYDEDIRYQNGYSIASPTKGIFHYRDTFRPLLFN